MNETLLTDETHNRAQGFGRGLHWIAGGVHEVWQRKTLWYGMTAVYFGLGFVLKIIPFLGDLLLILISPMLLAGVFWGRAQEGTIPPAPVPVSGSILKRQMQSWLSQPSAELLRIFSVEEKMFAAVLLGVITLGFAFALKMLSYLFVGGSFVTGLAASHMGTTQITTLLGMVLIAILSLVLAMGLFYSVPLTILGNRQPLAAITESFALCRANAVAWLTLIVPFYVIYLCIISVYAQDHLQGYLLVISAGFLVFPVFVAAAYSSYQSLFPPVPSESQNSPEPPDVEPPVFP